MTKRAALSGIASADEIVARLERLIVDLTDEIARSIDALPGDKEDPKKIAKDVSAAAMARVRGQLIRALEKAGGTIAPSARREALTVAKRAERELRAMFKRNKLDENLLPDAEQVIDDIMDSRLVEVAGFFQDARQELVAAMAVGRASGASKESLAATVADVMGVAIHKAQAVIETAIISVGRAYVTNMARGVNEDVGEDIMVLEGVGPRDRKNRPFCRKHNGGVYTVEAVEQLDNGQGLPVMETFGGYRCRHSWAAIPIDDAIAAGRKINRV